MGGLLRLRIEPGDASESWKRSEGRIVGEKYQLLSYLAGSDDSAVFLTSIKTVGGDSQEAVIKLIYVGGTDAEKQLGRWISARELNHPNLIRIFDAGRCEIEGMHLLYVVQEYAEENLAQILPERALTSEETRELLPPILGALQYLHDKGFAHGHLRPSNILAIGDQVKLSSDALVALGEKRPPATTANLYDPPESASDVVSAASDAWRLGASLIEVLTQHLLVWDRVGTKSPEIPRSLAEPFREIAKQCLQVEPDKRWTVPQILDRLKSQGEGAETGNFESNSSALALVQSENAETEKVRSDKTPPPAIASVAEKTSAKWPYFVALALAAVIAIAIFVIFKSKGAAPTAAVQTAQQQSAGAVMEHSSGAQGSAQPVPMQPVPTQSAAIGDRDAARHAAKSDETAKLAQDGVMRRVMPDIPASAQRTIHGRILVRVRVKADAAGNVEKANLQSGRENKYFSRMALEAAREWKFSPEPAWQSGDRLWNLQFAFTRAKTEVSATAVNR